MVAGSRKSLDAAGKAVALALTLLLVCLGLAACSGQPQPFSKATKGPGRTPPAIIVRSMAGLPPDKEAFLFKSLVAAAGPRDIAIVKGEFQGGYSLTGEFRVMPGPEGVTLDYRWSLVSDKGQPLHSIANSEPGRPVTGDPWEGIDPDTLRRVATYTTESLSSRLSQLGFSTQSAGLLPPSDTFVEAGPGAEKDIDPEVYGRLAAAVMWPQPVAANDPATANAAVPPLANAAAPPAEANVAAPPAADSAAIVKGDRIAPDTAAPADPEPNVAAAETAKHHISAVAVTRVQGAPGKGNGELLSAMRKVLKDAGWPVLGKEQSNALTIDGKVMLGQAQGKTQSVELHWTVRMPDGTVLGTVKQANRIEAGSLDKGWGEAAGYAAQGAAQGIFDLVGKAQKSL